MASNIPTFISIVVLLSGVLYQFVLRDFVTMGLGIGRSTQSLSEFPYDCRRIYHPKLEACEDAWIDDKTRTLYAACSSTAARLKWLPAGDAFNDTELGKTDHVSVLDIDAPGADGLFNLRQLKPVGYSGVAGDGSLRLHGFDAEAVDDNTLRFFLINHRTLADDTGERVDATKVGANSTLEVFEVKRGSNEMTHVKTVSSPAIHTPNKVAATGDGGFVVTNDHSGKLGFRRQLDLVLGGGSLTYCDAASKCMIGKLNGFAFPNGIVRGHDGLFYVPSSYVTHMPVLRLHANNGSLTEVATVELGLPVDNGAVDRNGDIYVAGFPKALKMLQSANDPWNANPPSTVVRVSKEGGQYKVEKVLEDGEGKVVAGATVARHDATTGRIFLGGAMVPYFMVCDKI